MKLKSILLFSFLAILFFIQPSLATEVSFERTTTSPVVYINLAIKAGSVHDPKDRSGLTQFMAKMLLRGTQKRSRDQIESALDMLGARLATETRAEGLIIRGAVLETEIEPFLDLLSEILTNPSFPEKEIRKLKNESLSQILQMNSSDSSLARARFERFLFSGHPYGQPTYGISSHINKITIKDLKSQYDLLIRSKHLVILGQGNIAPDLIYQWADKLSRERSGGQDLPKLPVTIQPQQKRLQFVDKPDRSQAQVSFGRIGTLISDPSYYPLTIGNHILGGDTFSSRLMQEIRVKRGWSYGAHSYFRYGTQPRIWQAGYSPAEKDTVSAMMLGLDLLKLWSDQGISEEEFNFAKKSLINNSRFSINTPEKRIEMKILEKTLGLRDDFFKDTESELSKVSREDVNRAIQAFYKPDSVQIQVLGTAKTLLAPVTQALKLSKKAVQVVPFDQE